MEKAINQKIREVLYFDFEKAVSIWSQVQWGLLKEVSFKSENDKNDSSEFGLGIPKIASMNIGVSDNEKRTIIETKILHHDLLNRIESELSENNLLVNINTKIQEQEKDAEKIREGIGEIPYIKACGWSVFEDYQKFLGISIKFNEIAEFIYHCSINNLEKSPEYQDIQKKIVSKNADLKKAKDNQQKLAIKSEIKSIENSLSLIKNTVPKNFVEDWILKGLDNWITTFMPKRMNFRVYPFESCPSFQLICNLKRNCFIDQDLEHLLYAYSDLPNIKLSVLGLITSIPSKDESNFDPLQEFQNNEKTKAMNIEEAYRNVFNAMREFENLVRYSRYPNITIYPIAIYREFGN